MQNIGNLRIAMYGSSHGKCVGCKIKGFPIGTEIDMKKIDEMMWLRKPGALGTGRKEKDIVVFAKGVENLKITEKTISIEIKNKNFDSGPYEEFKDKPRPGHADLPAIAKNKNIVGGGSFSGRMTAPLVAAGAIAKQILKNKGIETAAYTKKIHIVEDGKERGFGEIEKSKKYATHAATKDLDLKMTDAIKSAADDGDSVGGIVECMTVGLPIGFGKEWFDALDVTVSKAMMSIPGAKGIEFGKGFGLSELRGSESNDQYYFEKDKIKAYSNNLGGVCGGMSDGMPLVFRVVFKPTPSISKKQKTVNLSTGKNDVLQIEGKHDPCIVPRAVAVVEAMTSLAIYGQLD